MRDEEGRSASTTQKSKSEFSKSEKPNPTDPLTLQATFADINIAKDRSVYSLLRWQVGKAVGVNVLKLYARNSPEANADSFSRPYVDIASDY
jgi:hypothetical protein